MRLYELTEQYRRILAHIEDAEEDFTDEEWEAVLQVEDDFRAKVENLGKFIQSLNADVEAIKAERKRLADRQYSLARKVEGLKRYLVGALQATGTRRVKGQLLTVGLRKAPVSCVVEDLDAVPETFKRQIVEWKVDKKAVNAHFKETGEILPGVTMVTDKQTLSIR